MYSLDYAKNLPETMLRVKLLKYCMERHSFKNARQEHMNLLGMIYINNLDGKGDSENESYLGKKEHSDNKKN